MNASEEYINWNKNRQKIIKERRKAKKIGCIGWIITIIVSILGCIFWRWYALLISFGFFLVVSSIYSYYMGKKVQKDTGLNIAEQELVLKGYFPDSNTIDKSGQITNNH